MRFSPTSPLLLFFLVPAPALALSGPISESYSGDAVAFVNLAGRVEVEVGGSSIAVDISGQSEELASVSVSQERGTVRIESNKRRRRMSGDPADHAIYRLTVPAGTEIEIDGLVGEAKVGDIKADLAISASSLDAQIGDVKSASVSVGGAGDIEIGQVHGDLEIEIAGSGSVETGDAKGASIAIGGAGDVTTGAIAGGLNAAIAGSGEIVVASVNGPVEIEVAGSGDIEIRGGRANPLVVEVMGSGDVLMDGEAVDPDITVFGSGSVTLGSYTGRLKTSGQPNLTIKSK